MDGQEALWDDEPAYVRRGQVRRALDRDLATAESAGTVFLESEKAALRRQANDLDRLERLVAAKAAKTWDYTPKTQAHAAFSEAVARVFGRDTTDDDGFDEALEQFTRAEAERAQAQAGDTAGPDSAD